jgi:hypothetical protein
VKRFAAAAAVIALLAVPALAGGPTDEEANAWAKKVEEGMKARDPSFLDGCTDLEGVARRAFEGLSVEEKTATSFIAAIKGQPGWGTQIMTAALGKKGGWKFLRIVDRGTDKAAIFRATPETGGFTYDEFTLGKDANGRLLATDLYAYAGFMRISSVMRQAAITLALREDKELLGHLKGPEAEWARHAREVDAIANLSKSQKFPEVLEACKKLPESLQTQRTVLMFRMKAAKAIGTEEYKAVLDVLDKTYGQDPAMALALIDQAALDKNWKKALACLDTLDKAVGGDAYIDYKRCSIRFNANELDEAKAAGLRAIEKEPELVPAQAALVSVAVRAKDWKATRKGLETLEKLGVKLADLEKLPEFSEFVKTDEYAAWVKAHSEKK